MRMRLLGCVALLFTGVAQADDGVPALLQFAEQYQRQSTGPKSENAAPAGHPTAGFTGQSFYAEPGIIGA